MKDLRVGCFCQTLFCLYENLSCHSIYKMCLKRRQNCDRACEQETRVLDWLTHAKQFTERNELGNFIPSKKKMIYYLL